jgi:hypothetical protein
MGARRRFDAFAKEKSGFRAHYTDDGESTLVATKDAKGLDIEAVSKLPEPVYSDRNAFTTVHVPFAAWISFGPTGREHFEPSAAPMVARLGSDMLLRVEDDGRKERARGPLGRDEPLVVEIGHRDQKTASCRLTFKDWASQLSTEPAGPSAGSPPQNAIELSSKGDEVSLVFSLARPDGEGWPAAVGHAAGTYENRVRVDTSMDAPRPH